MNNVAELEIVMGPLRRRIALDPGEGLAWNSARECWQTRTETASFTARRGWWPPGWYMIELVAERSVTSVAAGFRFQTRKGAIDIDLPLRAGKPSKRLVHLPAGVRGFEFTPMNSEGDFCLQRFRLVWVTPRFARNRLLQRLINIHDRYRDLDQAAARSRVADQAAQRGDCWQRTAIREYESTYVSLCSRRNYGLWTREFERLPATQPLPPVTPAYRIVMPLTAETSVEAVTATLQSLQAQTPRHWRLTVAWPPCAGTAEAQALGKLHAALVAVAEAEPRLIVGEPGTAPEEAAPTSWVMLMAPGDRLAAHALFAHGWALEANPQARLIYADDDSLDAEGVRHSPRFKPAWNPDLLLSSPYIGRAVWVHAGTLNERLADSAWPQAAELDAWLARLALAAMALPAGACVHTDGILYHCFTPQRLAYATPQRLQRSEGYTALVREQLAAEPAVAEVSAGLLADTARVRWALPEPQPLVSLLVPTRDGIDILKPCVNAILARTDYRHFELLILDNQSRCPETLAYMADVEQRDARVKVLRWNHPFNYSAINNFGARHARGEVIGLINNDVEPVDGAWLSEMVSQALRPAIGCVGAKLYYPNDTVQHGGVVLGVGGVAGHAHRFFQRHEAGYGGRLKLVQNLSAVTAACLLLRREVFEQVGGLNETDLTVAYNDVDLCLKVQAAGYRNLWTPYAELYHHESISRGADDTPAKRARGLKEARYMRTHWADILDHDPAYNPNLTLAYEDFSLR